MRTWILPLLLGSTLFAQEVPIYEREMPTDPVELKKYMADLEKALKGVQDTVTQERNSAAQKTLERKEGDPELFEIPEKDEDEIAGATRRVITEKTVAADVKDLRKKLREGLDEEEVENADEFVGQFGKDPQALAGAAAVCWVEGAPGTALLLAAEAAERSPGDPNILNTLGSLLSQAGYGSRGIPLLNHLATRFPNDATLQNNLGQAWLGLGEEKKAEMHFAACLRLAPRHGPANTSMGVIKYCAGNQTEAASHFQTAASVYGSKVARRALKEMNLGHRTPRSFRRAIPVQEHFNARKFVVPTGQQTLQDELTKQAEKNAFADLIREHMEIAERKMTDAAQALGQNLMGQVTLGYARTLAPGNVTFAEIAAASSAFEDQGRRAARFQQDLAALVERLEREWQSTEAQVVQLRAAFEEQWKDVKIGEGAGPQTEAYLEAVKKLCQESEGAMNKALAKMAALYDQEVVALSTRSRVEVNEVLTVLPLVTQGDLYQQEFYKTVIVYLHRMGQLAASAPIKSYRCGPPPSLKDFKAAEGEMPSPGGCPVKINAKLVAVKLKADCKSVELAFDAGLQVSAKKDFRSGETTLKGGLGVGSDLSGYGELGGSAAVVVSWDGSNSLSFIGVESSASASLSGIPDLAGELGLSEDGSDDVTVGGTLKTGTGDLVNVSSETKLGVTLGPRGVEPTLSGSMGAEVLGRDLVKASL